MKNVAKSARLSEIEFPIKMGVVIYGVTYPNQINRGDTVKCIHCGHKFELNRYTAFKWDGLELAECPECGKKSDIAYYLGNVVKRAPEDYVEPSLV